MNVFHGRINRSKYFVALGFYLVAFFVLILNMSLNEMQTMYVKLVLDMLFLPFAVKRLHDLGVAGWLAGILLIPIPIISIILSTALMFQPGETKTNKYGHVPE